LRTIPAMKISRLVALCCVTSSIAAAQQPAPATQEERITQETLAAPLRFLADDLLEGRGVASRGDALARLYIETQFQFFGLAPGAGDRSFTQPVPIVGITSQISLPLTARGGGGEASFLAPDDYVAYAWRPLPTTEWRDAEVVFVGYGIHAPEQTWDDYKQVDVRGRVLLFMNDDPSSDPALFAGKSRLYYGRWSYKYEEAARRGAVGAIVIHTTPSAGYPFQVIQAKHDAENFWLPFDGPQDALQIASWMSEDAARKLAKLGGHDLDALRASAESREFKPVPLGVKVTLVEKNTVRELQSGNVIGRLEGSDPALRDQAVVVTAHFDHLGVGGAKQGDAIYNGALDNASGCASMLNIVRALSLAPKAPRRSVVFAAVTAEESGLLGSAYYARHPTVPPKQIVANFNIDGINIWGPTRDLQMVGHGKSTLVRVAEEVAARQGRKILPDAEPDKGLFYRSDHFSFAKIGVPSAYFKSGMDFIENADVKRRVQLSYTATHYHQPSDQFDARWNLAGAVEDTKLILECILRVADADQPPSWTPGDEFEKLR
jgi:Zn-dependent M28 family amino/carboxypeptidase